MPRVLLSLSALLLLAACTDIPSESTAVVSSSAASSELAELPLEQLPSELSIAHFSTMRLSGTGLVLEAVEARTNAYTRYKIAYESNGLRIAGILNIPLGEGPFPLLIFNHGYIDPDIYTQGRGLRREQDYMARAGFAVLHTDYRGHAGSDESPMDPKAKIYDGGLEYAMDSVNAIHAERAAHLPTIDAERVGMLGHSMGGGVTLSILTAYPHLVSAAVLYAPVHADVWENFFRWRHEREPGDRTMAVMKTRAENPAAWDAPSPETYLSAIQTPVLLFQGGNDKDVPEAWSDHLAERLSEEGKDITYVAYPGEGHEFGPQWTDFMRQSAAFFLQHLAPEPRNSTPLSPSA